MIYNNVGMVLFPNLHSQLRSQGRKKEDVHIDMWKITHMNVNTCVSNEIYIHFAWELKIHRRVDKSMVSYAVIPISPTATVCSENFQSCGNIKTLEAKIYLAYFIIQIVIQISA